MKKASLIMLVQHASQSSPPKKEFPATNITNGINLIQLIKHFTTTEAKKPHAPKAVSSILAGELVSPCFKVTIYRKISLNKVHFLACSGATEAA